MIGVVTKVTTVQQLYDYALKHNMLGADCKVVLDIINREKREVGIIEHKYKTPVNNTSTINFDTLIEYSINDLLTLLSL